MAVATPKLILVYSYSLDVNDKELVTFEPLFDVENLISISPSVKKLKDALGRGIDREAAKLAAKYGIK